MLDHQEIPMGQEEDRTGGCLYNWLRPLATLDGPQIGILMRNEEPGIGFRPKNMKKYPIFLVILQY